MMGRRDPYHDHVDPEYQRWGRTYRSFPGVKECVRLIGAGKATGAWADIVTYELTKNASEHLAEMIDVFHEHWADQVGYQMLMAIELAALPASVPFLTDLLHSDPQFRPYVLRGLKAIDTKEARTALYNYEHADPNAAQE